MKWFFCHDTDWKIWHFRIKLLRLCRMFIKEKLTNLYCAHESNSIRHICSFSFLDYRYFSSDIFIVGIIATVFNPFVSNTPFLYPLKISENRKVFWCFQGVGKGYIGKEWVNTKLMPPNLCQMTNIDHDGIKAKIFSNLISTIFLIFMPYVLCLFSCTIFFSSLIYKFKHTNKVAALFNIKVIFHKLNFFLMSQKKCHGCPECFLFKKGWKDLYIR